jgi:Ceramidase
MDVYCERVGPGLLAEPLNAITNVSFLLAAWAAWVLASRVGALSLGVRVLVGLAASVGVGSILWHTLATSWALILDTVPILLFIVWYIWLYTRNVLGLPSWFAVASIVVFLVATLVAVQYSHVLHGALVYMPGLLVTLVLGVAHAREQQVARFTLLAAAGVYAAALFFRTIDNEVCPVLPIGTHFLWHTLIGLVTYLAMRCLILSLASEDEPAGSNDRQGQLPGLRAV